MAKKNLQSVNEITKYLKKDKLLPIYFLSGEDNFSIEYSIEQIRKTFEQYVLSDFDKEIVTLEKSSNLNQILDYAYSFPFGGGKKLYILQNFEKVSDKKDLVNYVTNPPEFTLLIISYFEKVKDLSKEPFASLALKNYLFEARIETGEELINWVIEKANELNFAINYDLAESLIEIVGEEKSLIRTQIQKLSDYSLGKKEITFVDIQKIASPTKKYSIFDLQDALGKGDKSNSVEIAYNLLDSNQEIVVIINMISKFISTVAQITELIKLKVSDNDGAKMLGVSWYYYVNCKKAQFLMPDEKLLKASKALLNADLAVKTSSVDSKTILLVLITEMLK
ncbi:MAG: DNA polymerase III subunit delta [Ignavibacteria bacterium]|nr:DNA polymerase III subunit delta [Ignavibacteria bacterium]